MGPTWGPSGADRTQVGPRLVPLKVAIWNYFVRAITDSTEGRMYIYFDIILVRCATFCGHKALVHFDLLFIDTLLISNQCIRRSVTITIITNFKFKVQIMYCSLSARLKCIKTVLQAQGAINITFTCRAIKELPPNIYTSNTLAMGLLLFNMNSVSSGGTCIHMYTPVDCFSSSQCHDQCWKSNVI